MTLAMDKLDGCGFSNKVHCECLPKNEGEIIVLAGHFTIGGIAH